MQCFVRVAGLPVVQGLHQLVVQAGGVELDEAYTDATRVPNLELGLTFGGIYHLDDWTVHNPQSSPFLRALQVLNMLLRHLNSSTGEHMRKCRFITSRCCFVSLVMVSTACESDEAKLQRLNGDRAVACILAQKYHNEYEMVALQKPSPLKDSLLRQSTDYGTQCELATRDLNRFMR